MVALELRYFTGEGVHPSPMPQVRHIPVEEGESSSCNMNRSSDPEGDAAGAGGPPLPPRVHPPKIAAMLRWSEEWVRRVTQDSDRMCWNALYPNRAGGRPREFTKKVRKQLVDVALPRPKDHRYTVGPRTLERIRDTAVMEGIVGSVSTEPLREILHEEAASFRAVRTWKESKGPEFGD